MAKKENPIMRAWMKWKERFILRSVRQPIPYLNFTLKRNISKNLRFKQDKLYTWLQREHQSNSNPSCVDILNYLQNELDGEEMTMSPGPQFHNQMTPHQQLSLQQHQPSNLQTPANQGGVSRFTHQGRMGTTVDQSKVSIFTGALSSPNRRCLPPIATVYGSVNNAPVSRRPVGGLEQFNEVASEEREATPAAHTQAFSAPSDQLHNQSVTGACYNQAPSQHREARAYVENDSSMDMHDGMYHHSFYR